MCYMCMYIYIYIKLDFGPELQVVNHDLSLPLLARA